MRISIIGAGNMGGALARGLAQGTRIAPADICVSNPSQGKLEALKAAYPTMRTTNDNVACILDTDLIVLAVKPWIVGDVLNEIASHLQSLKGSKKMPAIASMVGGMAVDDLEKKKLMMQTLDTDAGALPPLFCLIPNTAIAVCQSMTFFCSKHSTPEHDSQLLTILQELGDAMQVRPDQMAGGTALASCGIAFAMRYLRAATEGGVQLGFYAHDAQRIVMQTLKGMVELLKENGTHPEVEIDRVTTPGGITIKGLNAMERAGFTNAVIEGLLAAKK